jgi:hypothetical protein
MIRLGVVGSELHSSQVTVCAHVSTRITQLPTIAYDASTLMKMAVGVVVLDPRTESTTDHTRTVQRTTINVSDCHVHGVVEFLVRILEYILQYCRHVARVR